MYFGFKEQEVRERLVEGLLNFMQGDETKLRTVVKDIWRAAVIVFLLMLLVLALSYSAALGALPVLAWFFRLMVSLPYALICFR